MPLVQVRFEVEAAARAVWEAALEAPTVALEGVLSLRERRRGAAWEITIVADAMPGDIAAVIARVADAAGLPRPDSHVVELPPVDWVAENQRSFRPLRAGRFWLHPSHDPGRAPPDLHAIRMDAGSAFGSGSHGTTRGCLELLSGLDVGPTAQPIDVGTGSGILAIAMAQLWRRPVLASDNDPATIPVAARNAADNGVGALCRFAVASGLDSEEISRAGPFDPLVANILAAPLIELAPHLARATRAGARVVLSGLLVEQAADVLDAYERAGFRFRSRLDLETGGDHWRSLLLERT
ncbi:MAG: 50S ribosomal protein L11 methyltransferase [Alphaproteobacteria bacterium]|nr:50S ribosomal protein L11 methyltransferase [Alphaproteobacteria bacterium]